jgi:septal ring factor EnvC (AmiA/AmiB activator)
MVRAHDAQRGCIMATVGIAEAARMAGVAQSTVHRAMQAGRLSYTIDPAGKRRIDVAELQRVFEIKPAHEADLAGSNGALPENIARTVQRKTAHHAETEAMRRVLDEHERTIARQDEAIRDLRASLDDLRARLDASEAERRRVQERLTALLTHRSSSSVPAVQPAGGRVPWWRRWFR